MINPNQFYDIYLITMDQQDQHWYRINQGAYDMAQMLGVNYFWEAPVVKDTQRQIEILNQVVARGANAVMIAANDPVLISGAIEDAKANLVRIIYVDSPAYEEAVTTLSTDNYNAGQIAASQMLSQFNELGINSGSIGIIGVNEVTLSTVRREAGFREIMDEDGRFTLLATVYANGDPAASEEAAVNMYQSNPDLVGLFGTNEGSTEGVGNAIKNANMRVIGIGFDQSTTILELIRDGYLQAAVVQNPYTMGYLGMAQAVAALRGFDTGPESIDTGVVVFVRRT